MSEQDEYQPASMYSGFDIYQHKALYTLETERDAEIQLARFSLGVADEAGEVAGAVKKYYRGDYGELGSDEAIQELRERVRGEAGDVFWYLALLLDLLDLRMSEVAEYNNKKLLERRQAGTIKGDGEDR